MGYKQLDYPSSAQANEGPATAGIKHMSRPKYFDAVPGFEKGMAITNIIPLLMITPADVFSAMDTIMSIGVPVISITASYVGPHLVYKSIKAKGSIDPASLDAAVKKLDAASIERMGNVAGDYYVRGMTRELDHLAAKASDPGTRSGAYFDRSDFTLGTNRMPANKGGVEAPVAKSMVNSKTIASEHAAQIEAQVSQMVPNPPASVGPFTIDRAALNSAITKLGKNADPDALVSAMDTQFRGALKVYSAKLKANSGDISEAFGARIAERLNKDTKPALETFRKKIEAQVKEKGGTRTFTADEYATLKLQSIWETPRQLSAEDKALFGNRMDTYVSEMKEMGFIGEETTVAASRIRSFLERHPRGGRFLVGFVSYMGTSIAGYTAQAIFEKIFTPTVSYNPEAGSGSGSGSGNGAPSINTPTPLNQQQNPPQAQQQGQSQDTRTIGKGLVDATKSIFYQGNTFYLMWPQFYVMPQAGEEIKAEGVNLYKFQIKLEPGGPLQFHISVQGPNLGVGWPCIGLDASSKLLYSGRLNQTDPMTGMDKPVQVEDGKVYSLYLSMNFNTKKWFCYVEDENKARVATGDETAIPAALLANPASFKIYESIFSR